MTIMQCKSNIASIGKLTKKSGNIRKFCFGKNFAIKCESFAKNLVENVLFFRIVQEYGGQTRVEMVVDVSKGIFTTNTVSLIF